MPSIPIPVEKLPDIVAGRDTSFARGHAMAALAASTLPQKEALLASVLESPAEEARWRIAAATALGRIASGPSERILLRNLARADTLLMPQLLKSLGRIGDASAIAAIDALALPPAHPAAAAAAYATALIAHRFGLEGHDLPSPGEATLLERPSASPLPIKVDAADPDLARHVLAGLERYPYRIAFDATRLTRLSCSGEVNVLCVNAELSTEPTKVTKRKALFALAALQSAETGDFSPSYVVLTRPRGSAGSVDIFVTRCSGRLVLAGTARAGSDGRLEFELRSVRLPGARAISLRGTVDSGGFHVSEAITTSVQEPRRDVKRLKPTARRAVTR